MAPAKHEKRDIAIAYKAFALHRECTGDFKSVGAALMDHLNPVTGRCDPSLDRLARMLDMSEKNVRRATARLCELGLFTKKSHGGKAGCASYTPVWAEFRAVVSDWQERMKTGTAPEFAIENRTELSSTNRTELSGSTCTEHDLEPDNFVPTTGQFGPVEPDRNVLQTKPRNQTKNQCTPSVSSGLSIAREIEPTNSEQTLQGLLKGNAGDLRSASSQPKEPVTTKSCSRAEVAWGAAGRRLAKAIGCEDREWRAAMWLLEVDDMDLATDAEVTRRGEGIVYLRERMLEAKMRYDSGLPAESAQ